jgi:hypothetical protein
LTIKVCYFFVNIFVELQNNINKAIGLGAALVLLAVSKEEVSNDLFGKV